MKTNHIIISKSIAGVLPMALLAASLVAPFTASARDHSSSSFGESRPNFAAAGRATEIVREPTVTIPKGVNRTAAVARIDRRLAALDARLPAGTVVTENVRLSHGRVARTREYLYGLVDLGTPDWEINAWTDALAQNQIVAGMPSDLVLDYWGNPMATDSVIIAGGPAAVWTYRVQPGKTERITVARGAVTNVRRL